MFSPLDHPSEAAGLAVLAVTVPLLLVVVMASVMAIWSAAAPSSKRRRHTRRLLRDLTELARVLRSGG